MSVDDIKKLIDKYELNQNIGLSLYVSTLEVIEKAKTVNLTPEDFIKGRIMHILAPHLIKEVLGE